MCGQETSKTSVDWGKFGGRKLEVMRAIIRAKAKYVPKYRRELLKCDAIVETVYGDNYWSCGLKTQCAVGKRKRPAWENHHGAATYEATWRITTSRIGEIGARTKPAAGGWGEALLGSLLKLAAYRIPRNQQWHQENSWWHPRPRHSSRSWVYDDDILAWTTHRILHKFKLPVFCSCNLHLNPTRSIMVEFLYSLLDHISLLNCT